MSSSQNSAWHVVVAGTTAALSRKDRWRLEADIDAPIKDLCARMNLTCYIPSRFTNRAAEQSSDLRAEYDRIARSGVLVAYVGVNDSRTGLQLGWAHVAQVPIVLLHEVGNSEIADEYRLQQLAIYDTIRFRDRDHDDLANQLAQTLFWLLSEQNLSVASAQAQWSASDKEEKHRRLDSLRRRGQKLAAPVSVKKWSDEDPLLELERMAFQHPV